MCCFSILCWIHRQESAIGMHMSPSSWSSLPPPTHSHHTGLSPSSGVNSLHHAANSHWLSIFIYGVYFKSLCLTFPTIFELFEGSGINIFLPWSTCNAMRILGAQDTFYLNVFSSSIWIRSVAISYRMIFKTFCTVKKEIIILQAIKILIVEYSKWNYSSYSCKT